MRITYVRGLSGGQGEWDLQLLLKNKFFHPSEMKDVKDLENERLPLEESFASKFNFFFES